MTLAARDRGLALAEIVTVGLPFCAFKLVCGHHLPGAAGLVLGGLAMADALLNGVNALGLLIKARRIFPVCTLQGLTLLVRRSERSRNVGSALDTLLSFSLVATMIATGALPHLSPGWLLAWNVAVVLNVLGAGAMRLEQALMASPSR